jgi:hypothetical protein
MPPLLDPLELPLVDPLPELVLLPLVDPLLEPLLVPLDELPLPELLDPLPELEAPLELPELLPLLDPPELVPEPLEDPEPLPELLDPSPGVPSDDEHAKSSVKSKTQRRIVPPIAPREPTEQARCAVEKPYGAHPMRSSGQAGGQDAVHPCFPGVSRFMGRSVPRRRTSKPDASPTTSTTTQRTSLRAPGTSARPVHASATRATGALGSSTPMGVP